MQEKWASMYLGECFRIKHGWAFKGQFFARQGRYILLTPGNFNPDGGIKLKGDKEKYYVGDFPDEFLLKFDDFLVVMTDLTQDAPILGSPAFVKEDDTFLHNQRLGKIVDLDQTEMDRSFLYYLFNFPSVRNQIKATATGATVKHTAPDRIYNVTVNLPPLPTQRKIAVVLSVYDDLIENNTRRIEILEEMASAIYREWFVEFRFPGHEEIEMVEEELGLIPQGWEVGLINELVDFKSGYAFKSNTFVDQGKYHIVTIKNVKDGDFQPVCDNKIGDLPSNLPNHCHLKNGDILLSLTGNVGRVCLVYGNNYLLNQRVAKLVPKNPDHYPFVYTMFRQKELQLRLEAIATGVAQQNLSPIKAGRLTCFIPRPRLLSQFSNLVKPYIEQILNLNQKNITLRQTRDLLLPRLISGEIDISELDLDTN